MHITQIMKYIRRPAISPKTKAPHLLVWGDPWQRTMNPSSQAQPAISVSFSLAHRVFATIKQVDLKPLTLFWGVWTCAHLFRLVRTNAAAAPAAAALGELQILPLIAVVDIRHARCNTTIRRSQCTLLQSLNNIFRFDFVLISPLQKAHRIDLCNFEF
jgi:hypothetical protein